MEKKEATQILMNAIKVFGSDAQMLMAIEEMSELIKAICKEKRARDALDDEYFNARQNLLEEIADVEIMLEQLLIIFGVDISGIKNKKLERLKERLAETELKCPLGGDETDDCADCTYSPRLSFYRR